MNAFTIVLALLCAWAAAAPLRRVVARAWGLTPSEPPQVPHLRAPSYRTLDAAMHDPRGDNLLLLRLLAASLVIYAHSYAISGIPGATDLITRTGIGIYAGSIAVYMFFAISGFLVTGSWLRRQALGSFLASRALRIVPAYAVCLAGSALVLGPLVTTLATDAYFAHPETWRYVWHNLAFPLDMQWTLPGVFADHPRQAVNGSLWTLPAEVRVYLWLALFGVLGLLLRPSRALLALLLLAAVAHDTGTLPLLAIKEFLPMAGCFALGGLAWLLRRVLPLNGWCLMALVAVALLFRGTGFYLHAFLLALAYGVLWAAYIPRFALWFNRVGDYSYGLYLWGFPMQQLAVHVLDTPTPTQISLFAWPAALLLSILSWHAVEKPLLSLRRRSGGASVGPPEAGASSIS